MDKPGDVIAGYQRALEKRRWIESDVDSAYEMALPLRQRLYHSTKRPETDRLFDATAVTGLQQFASQMLDDVWPIDSDPFVLEPGPDAPPSQRDTIKGELRSISEQIYKAVNNSRFRTSAHESFQDFGIGTGVMLVLPGDVAEPLRFISVPLTESAMDVGPWGEIDRLYRPRELEIGQVAVAYPKATLPREWLDMMRDQPEAKVKLVECTYRDWDAPPGEEVWRFSLVDDAGKHALHSEEWRGSGSCPFIAFSFSRVSGEVMGRGPVMHALPDIRTVNAMREMTLEAADLQLSGVWMYDDDGVINPDTAVMTPGALIPRTPGQKGLEPITPNLNFNFAHNEIERLRADIREAMFVPQIGPGGKTPPSATQVMEEGAQRAKRLAGPYGNLLVEFLFPLVKRIYWMMRHNALLRTQFQLPPIDGRRIALRPLAPITRALAQANVLRHTRFLDITTGYFGQQAAALSVDVEKFLPWLAEQTGFDPRLLRSEQSKKQMVEMAAAAMQQQQGGQAPAAPAPMPT